MILLLDTSTSCCHLTLVDDDDYIESEWDAGRDLAKGLLLYLEAQLQKQDKTFADISHIGAFIGPGSFTGLRIGLTVLNSLADSLSLPIVGTTGDNWKQTAVSQLLRGKNERIVLPLYGSAVHITQPRK